MRKIIPLLRGYFNFAAYHTSSKECNDAFDIEYLRLITESTALRFSLKRVTHKQKKIIQVFKSHMFQI